MVKNKANNIISKLILVISLLFLSACGKEEYTIIHKDYKGVILTETKTIDKNNISSPELEEREGYIFLGWNKNIDEKNKVYEFSPIYELEKKIVIWLNYDGSILNIDNDIDWNSDIIYRGTIPKKDSDREYDYIFLGWNIEKYDDKKSQVNTAVYEKKPINYEVEYNDFNGDVILKLTKKYNDKLEHPNPVEREGYIFLGWSEMFNEENSTYKFTPIYELKKKTIIWLNYDGSKLQINPNIGWKDNIEYQGETPVKEGDQQYDYKFVGWDAYIVNDQVIVYKALYKQHLREYKAIFLDYDDKILKEVNFIHGENLDLNYIPERLGYKFINWDSNEKERNKMILKANYEIDALNLPVMSIELHGIDLDSVSRDKYVESNISLLNVEKKQRIEGVKAEFKGRGNGSWEYDKKGYRIKFDKKQGLFGESKSKHWVLVANGHDKSLMRNNLAYGIAKDVLDDIEYTTSVNIVELYINGKYHGVYSIFEHIRVDENRINIDEEYGVLDTGYLIEYDAYAVGREGIDYFRVDGLKYPFTVKSPDPSDYIKKGISEDTYRSQVEFIANYIQEIVNAVIENDYEKIKEMVDIKSVIDVYIIHEFFKNTDTGYSSFYMYKKKQGKLYFGPIWDFDYSSGISRGDSSYEGLYVSENVLIDSEFTSNEIYIQLMKNEQFVKEVKERLSGILDQIENKILTMFNEITRYEDSYDRDAMRWEINKGWSSEQSNLKEWLLNRKKWLESWINM